MNQFISARSFTSQWYVTVFQCIEEKGEGVGKADMNFACRIQIFNLLTFQVVGQRSQGLAE